MEIEEKKSWDQRFRDESEASSEDLTLLDESPRLRRTIFQRLTFRLFGEVAMIVLIIALSAIVISNKVQQASAPLPYGPVIREKVVTFGDNAGFGPDVVYADIDMLLNGTRMREVHENWQQMYPISRGYYVVEENHPDYRVQFPPADISGLISPDDHRTGYVVAVFHQLHCLSLIMTRLGTSRAEFATWERSRLGHTAHCVEYLRQSILCSADTTLEGGTEFTSEVIGMGQNHMCKDYNHLIEQTNERAAWDLRNLRDPQHFDMLHDMHN